VVEQVIHLNGRLKSKHIDAPALEPEEGRGNGDDARFTGINVTFFAEQASTGKLLETHESIAPVIADQGAAWS
jgi:hypothetical protein